MLRYLRLLAGAGQLLIGNGLRADDTPVQKEVRARREALVRAFNARSAREVLAFLDPSFEIATKTNDLVRVHAREVVRDEVASLPRGAVMTQKIEKIAV